MTIRPKSPPDKPELTAERLRELLHYDPETGVFVRLTSTRRPDLIQHIAGTTSRGYVAIYIEGAIYRAHRLAWLYMIGSWPDCEIDHVNNSRSDNRWSNLRLATRTQNARNSLTRSDSKSGKAGVCRHGNGWRAYIYVASLRRNLGTFTDKADAIAARRAAELEHFGEFAPRHDAVTTT